MPRKTYIVDISDLDKTWKNFKKRTRYEIRKCGYGVHKTKDILWFDILHFLTRPDRKIGLWQILWWWITKKAQLYTTGTAMAMIGIRNGVGQYLMAARIPNSNDGSPSKILWEAMKDLNKMGIREMDLCGANKQNIVLFKRGFGGKLIEQKCPCLKY